MSFIFLILLFSTSAVALIFIHRGLPGSARDMGWKMSGVWSNPRNLHVLLHANGARMRGHVVSSIKDEAESENSLVIKELAVKPLWQWSDATFVEPGSRLEHRVRVRLEVWRRTLCVKFPENKKAEEWKLIDPL
jgi:hypothetical protein